MSLIIEFEKYYLPVRLSMVSTEKEGIVHSYIGCVNHKTPISEMEKICEKCKAENVSSTVGKIYPEGYSKEEVGSRDMWGFERVGLSDIPLHLITNWKWLEVATVKKPKASELARFKDTQAKMGKSPTLKDLFEDLGGSRTVLKGKIVLLGKINECFIIPYRFNGYTTVAMGIADGNKVSIEPKENYKIEEIKPLEVLS